MKKLSKDEIKQLTATALLDVISNVVGGPVGVVLPVLGNVILGIKDTVEVKEEIEKLKEEQQNEIKERLGKFYEMLVAEKNMCSMEIYSVDALEIFFRSELELEELKNMEDMLKEYREEGIEFDDEPYCDGDLGVAIDSHMITKESIIINLVEPCEKELVMELVELIDRMVREATRLNEVKKVQFY